MSNQVRRGLDWQDEQSHEMRSRENSGECGVYDSEHINNLSLLFSTCLREKKHRERSASMSLCYGLQQNS